MNLNTTISSLEDLLRVYPSLRLATPADNDLLLRLTARAPMSSAALAIGYDRGRDYFAFQRLQSRECYTFLLTDPGAAEPTGLATIGLRPGYIDGEPATVGLLGDLRMRRGRSDRSQWSRIAAELLRGLAYFPETNAAATYCAVLGGNARALSALTGGSGQIDAFKPVTSYDIVHVFGRLPWCRDKASRFSAAVAGPQDLSEIEDFLDQDQRPLPFGYCFADGELAHRLRVWPGLSLDGFFIVRDASGKIRGVTAPWSPGAAKQVVVTGMPRSWQLGLKLGAKLLRSRELPRVGEPLRTLYLTHLAVDRGLPAPDQRAVFRALFDGVYRAVFGRGATPQPHALAFSAFAGDGRREALGGYICHALPAHIMVTASTPVAATACVGLEMALI